MCIFFNAHKNVKVGTIMVGSVGKPDTRDFLLGLISYAITPERYIVNVGISRMLLQMNLRHRNGKLTFICDGVKAVRVPSFQ